MKTGKLLFSYLLLFLLFNCSSPNKEKKTSTYVSNSCFAVEAIPKSNKNSRYMTFGYVARTKDLQHYPFEFLFGTPRTDYTIKKKHKLIGNFYCLDQEGAKQNYFDFPCSRRKWENE